MASSVRPRCSFTPEALIKFALVFDDVWKELANEGVRAFDGRTHSAHAASQKGLCACARALDGPSDQTTARAGLSQ